MSQPLLRDAGQSLFWRCACLVCAFATPRSDAPRRTLWLADHASYRDVPFDVGGGLDAGATERH